MALTLGLQTGHESSAALFRGTQWIAAISDERLTRIKNDGGQLTDGAMDAVLAMGQSSRADVDRLALLYTFFPDEYFVRETWYKELERRLSRLRKRRSGAQRPNMLLSNFLERLQARGQNFKAHFREQRFKDQEGFPQTGLAFYDHHDAHAIAAAYFSGFPECAVITIDGQGDWGIHHSSGIFRAGHYQRAFVSQHPAASAGAFYGQITELLGYKQMRHEGKVVGLAAMGDPQRLYESISPALMVSPDGQTLVSAFADEAARTAHLRQRCQGASREDISAATQQRLEDVVLELVTNYLRHSGQRKLALNGGVFANVKLNQRIAALPEVDQLFVFPAMSDTGNSVGAALLDIQAHQPDALAHASPLADVYLGPAFTDAHIATALEQQNLLAQATLLNEETLVGKAAQAIHEGLVVGWFQGRMEFGPRALGNRSMLARPTDKGINDWLNQRLDRSEFMPFAPSVLAEYADELFIGVEKARHAAEFMTVTFDVIPAWRERIKAVVHVDGTARPQLVRADRNPLYHRLIAAYHQLSGIPLVLNTSFNVHEEPIVCAPDEAIRAFVEKRVDCLGIGHYWLQHRN